MNGVEWLAQRIIASTTPERRKELRFNPRPPGVIRPDSATEAVLIFFRGNQGRWFERFEIMNATGRTMKSVDWALQYLRHLDLISTAPTGRNSEYHKYALKE